GLSSIVARRQHWSNVTDDRPWRKFFSTSLARATGSNRGKRRSDATLDGCSTANLCHAAAAPLHSARIAAAALGVVLLADHADDHLGIHVHLPRHQFELGGASRRRAACRGPAVGCPLPWSARPVAILHGGDVV